MNKLYIVLGLTALLLSCAEKPEALQTQPEDYNSYLSTENRDSYELALSQKEFWSKRLRPDSSGVGDLAPLASAYTQLFETTGDATYLSHSETLLTKGMTISGNNKDGFARSLAHNLISQHRFQDAKRVLEDSYAGPSDKHQTELMLFDVYMELGQYDLADQFLGKIKNPKDYHYLTRLSKWMDYKGDLDAAIKYMEQARTIAESRDSKPLRIWTYSNLGDYYGHAGRIEEAYRHYLKTLQLQPDNAYAKKGIAWITYAAEGKVAESLRILDSIMKQHQLPDYHLFKAELAEYANDPEEAKRQEQLFLQLVSTGDYGVMYNTYLIELFADQNPEKALEIARQEVTQRATPETYHLLALAQLKNGMKEEALSTIQNHVAGKTYEPMAAYHSALVYQAHGMSEQVTAIKQELAEAAFELGPVLARNIEQL